jgi:hypothetical protein
MTMQRGNQTLSPAGRSLPGVGQVTSLDVLAPTPEYYRQATGMGRIQQPGVGQMVENQGRPELALLRQGIGTENRTIAPFASGEVNQTGLGDLLRTRQRTALPGATLPSEDLLIGAGTNPLTQGQSLIPAIPLGDISAAQAPGTAALGAPQLTQGELEALGYFGDEHFPAHMLQTGFAPNASFGGNPPVGGGGGFGGPSAGAQSFMAGGGLGGVGVESAAPTFQPAPLPVTQQTQQPQFVQAPAPPPPPPPLPPAASPAPLTTPNTYLDPNSYWIDPYYDPLLWGTNLG